MPLKIHLAGSLDDDFNSASLEDPFSQTLIAQSQVTDPSVVCHLAAKRLRELAWKFEQLAKTRNPFSVRVQSRINRLVMPDEEIES